MGHSHANSAIEHASSPTCISRPATAALDHEIICRRGAGRVLVFPPSPAYPSRGLSQLQLMTATSTGPHLPSHSSEGPPQARSLSLVPGNLRA